MLQKLYKLFFFLIEKKNSIKFLILFYFMEFQSMISASNVELLDIMFKDIATIGELAGAPTSSVLPDDIETRKEGGWGKCLLTHLL